MLEPQILGPYLIKHANMPTQIPIGEANGGIRPSIPEYPQIAEYIKEALDAVFYGTASPQEALDDAADKSAKALGW